MRLKDNGNSFTIWLSARDTYEWARKPGAAWPCATLANKRVCASFDTNGIYDLTINGLYPTEDGGWIDGNEFSALIADHAKTRLSPDHPCYFVAIGQFEDTDTAIGF